MKHWDILLSHGPIFALDVIGSLSTTYFDSLITISNCLKPFLMIITGWNIVQPMPIALQGLALYCTYSPYPLLSLYPQVDPLLISCMLQSHARQAQTSSTQPYPTIPYPILPYPTLSQPTLHHPNPTKPMGCAQYSNSEKFARVLGQMKLSTSGLSFYCPPFVAHLVDVCQFNFPSEKFSDL